MDVSEFATSGEALPPPLATAELTVGNIRIGLRLVFAAMLWFLSIEKQASYYIDEAQYGGVGGECFQRLQIWSAHAWVDSA